MLEIREPSARYLVDREPALLRQFEFVATAPEGVATLRNLILALATQGKLVRQETPTAAVLPPASEGLDISLPSGWQLVKLGDVVDVLDRLRQPVKKEDRKPGPYPYYGASGVVDHVDGFIFDEALVLVGEDGAKWGAGDATAFAIAGKTWVNNHAHVLRPRRECLSDAYLVLALTAMDLSSYVTGMTVPKLNQGRLVSVTVALPPLAEQSRIVARVDELMRLCDALEAKGRLEAEQHARLLSTLLGTLTDSRSPKELAANWQRIAAHFDLLLDRPEAVDAVEQIVLDLAVRGLLLQQSSTDAPARKLLDTFRLRREQLTADGRIKRDKPPPPLDEDEKPFDLPIGWEWVRFDELIDPTKPISYGVLVPGPEVPDGISFVRIADLSITDPAQKPEKSISAEVDAQFQRTRLEGGEILMGVVGSIGKLGVAPSSWAGANIARAICRIVPWAEIDRRFVLLLLESQLMQRSFTGDTRTLAQPTLNVGLIRSSPTPLPPHAEQVRIVDRVTALRRLCSDLRQRLAASRVAQARLADTLVVDAV